MEDRGTGRQAPDQDQPVSSEDEMMFTTQSVDEDGQNAADTGEAPQENAEFRTTASEDSALSGETTTSTQPAKDNSFPLAANQIIAGGLLIAAVVAVVLAIRLMRK
jgi:hypothetical protein